MPRYDYRCDQGTVTEATREMAVSEIACPDCGGVAQRQAVYANQAIRGDTVARGTGRASAITKNGYIDIDQGFEAIEDVQRTARKRGEEPPDLFREAQRRVATGEATKQRITQ